MAERVSPHRVISISTLVAQLVLAIALPLSVVALYGLYREANTEYSAGENMVLRLAEATAEDSTQFINNTRELVQKLAQRPAIRALDWRHCDPVLAEIPGLFPRYTNALTVAADGTLLCSAAPIQPQTPRKVPPRFWFDEMRQRGAVVVGQPARGFVTGKWVSTIAAPIMDAGVFRGAIAISVDLRAYQPFESAASLPPGTNIKIINSRGVVVASLTDPETVVGTSVLELPLTQTILREGEGIAHGVGADNIERIYAFKPVPGSDWYVYAGMPVNSAFAAINRNLMQALLITLAAAVLAAFGGRIAIRRIVIPLRALGAVADRVAAGDFSARASTAGLVEAGNIAAQFNRMLDLQFEESTRLQLVVQAASIGLWDWNLHNDAVVFSSPYKRQIGYADDEIGNRLEEWSSRVHPDDLEPATAKVRTFLANPEGGLENEFRFRHKDGRYLWILARGLVLFGDKGEPARMLGCHIDITSIKELEQALRQSESRSRRLFEQAGSGIVVLSVEFKVLEVNARYAEMLGYTREELLAGMTVAEILAPHERSRLQAAADMLLPDRPNFAEWEQQRKDGSCFPVEVSTRILDDGSYLCIVHDLSERKAAERAIANQAQRLRVLSRQLTEVDAAARRRLARELHDRVGQNLSSLIMSLNRMKSEMPAAVIERSGKWFDDSTQLLGQVVGEVRSVMSELRPAELDDFGLLQALGFYAEQAGLRAGFRVSVRAENGEPQLPLGIETALYRIAQEAVTNIAKHAHASEAAIVIGIHGQDVSLCISDNGRGIVDGENMMPGARRGVLGMRERAEAIGAQFEFESDSGRGTRVTVRVPAALERRAVVATE